MGLEVESLSFGEALLDVESSEFVEKAAVIESALHRSVANMTGLQTVRVKSFRWVFELLVCIIILARY